MPSVAIRWVDAAGLVQSSTGAGLEPYPAAPSLVWVDITTPDDAVLAELCSRFGFHTLAVEDVRHPQSRPKLDIYPDGLFLAWLAPRHLAGDGVVADEIDIFI